MQTHPRQAIAEEGQRTFGPLVDECRARGIGRTVAFELARDGLIETFNIGRRRYVKLESLDSLPDRIEQGGEQGAKV